MTINTTVFTAPTKVWGFNGNVPGETFHARYGEPVMIRRYNQLPADHVGFALPSFTTHLHNLHHASESDGMPWDWVDPGYFWDYHHVNALLAAIRCKNRRLSGIMITAWILRRPTCIWG